MSTSGSDSDPRRARGPRIDVGFFRTVLRNTRDVVLISSPDGEIVEAFGLAALGYADDEAVGEPVFRFVDDEDHALARSRIERVLAGVEIEPFELRTRSAGGAMRWYEVSPTRHVDADGRPWLVSISRDVDERKRVEAAIQASEERYRTLVDQSPLGILLVDADLDVVSANEAYARQVGAPSVAALEGHNVMASPALDPGSLAGLAERVRSGERISAALSYESLFGKQVDVKVHVSPIRDDDGVFSLAQLVFEDVSETRRLEGQLRQSQKLEAVGRLAGGIAHDFNNDLTVILGLAEHLAESRGLDAEEREAALEIVRASERSAALTRQLLTFSRREPRPLQPLDLGRALMRAERLLEVVAGDAVALELEVSPDVPPVEADAPLFEQVLVNLASNARDAMPQGGRLRVAVGRDRDAPSRVLVTVHDSGHGMDEATSARSFEPFFSTKPVDRATGLGLSVVYGIVEEFGGDIDLDSRPGEGTCVRMRFPVTGSAARSR